MAGMKKKPEIPPERSTYRHGDLRRALIDAGVALAREGGPEAVVLREATRRAGVSPNAAYRHFANRDELIRGVRAQALAELALAMEAELAKLKPSKSAAYARACVRAVGTGCLEFAQDQPGLYRAAFTVGPAGAGDGDPAKAGASGLNPFQLLAAALDKLVDAGVMAPARRPGAEYLAWSAVHGLALLIIEGPLKGRLNRTQTRAMGQRLLDMVEKGLG